MKRGSRSELFSTGWMLARAEHIIKQEIQAQETAKTQISEPG